MSDSANYNNCGPEDGSLKMEKEDLADKSNSTGSRYQRERTYKSEENLRDAPVSHDRDVVGSDSKLRDRKSDIDLYVPKGKAMYDRKHVFDSQSSHANLEDNGRGGFLREQGSSTPDSDSKSWPEYESSNTNTNRSLVNRNQKFSSGDDVGSRLSVNKSHLRHATSQSRSWPILPNNYDPRLKRKFLTEHNLTNEDIQNIRVLSSAGSDKSQKAKQDIRNAKAYKGRNRSSVNCDDAIFPQPGIDVHSIEKDGIKNVNLLSSDFRNLSPSKLENLGHVAAASDYVSSSEDPSTSIKEDAVQADEPTKERDPLSSSDASTKLTKIVTESVDSLNSDVANSPRDLEILDCENDGVKVQESVPSESIKKPVEKISWAEEVELESAHNPQTSQVSSQMPKHQSSSSSSFDDCHRRDDFRKRNTGASFRSSSPPRMEHFDAFSRRGRHERPVKWEQRSRAGKKSDSRDRRDRPPSFKSAFMEHHAPDAVSWRDPELHIDPASRIRTTSSTSADSNDPFGRSRVRTTSSTSTDSNDPFNRFTKSSKSQDSQEKRNQRSSSAWDDNKSKEKSSNVAPRWVSASPNADYERNNKSQPVCDTNKIRERNSNSPGKWEKGATAKEDPFQRHFDASQVARESVPMRANYQQQAGNIPSKVQTWTSDENQLSFDLETKMWIPAASLSRKLAQQIPSNVNENHRRDTNDGNYRVNREKLDAPSNDGEGIGNVPQFLPDANITNDDCTMYANVDSSVEAIPSNIPAEKFFVSNSNYSSDARFNKVNANYGGNLPFVPSVTDRYANPSSNAANFTSPPDRNQTSAINPRFDNFQSFSAAPPASTDFYLRGNPGSDIGRGFVNREMPNRGFQTIRSSNENPPRSVTYEMNRLNESASGNERFTSGNIPGIIRLPQQFIRLAGPRIEGANLIPRNNSNQLGLSANYPDIPTGSSGMQSRTIYNPRSGNELWSESEFMAQQRTLTSVPPPSIYSRPPPALPQNAAQLLQPNRNVESESAFSALKEKIMDDVNRAEKELQNLVLYPNILSGWSRIGSLKEFLLDLLRRMLLMDVKLCVMEDFDRRIWKVLFHSVVDGFRRAIFENPSSAQLYKEQLMSHIGKGTVYFSQLVTQLTEHYHIDVNAITQQYPQRHAGVEGLVVLVIQRFYMYLGDLDRYKASVLETSHPNNAAPVARQYYLKAIELNPKDGKAYNKMAILSLLRKRQLDTIYYHARSLMAFNAIQTARDSLLGLFEGNNKQYKVMEMDRRKNNPNWSPEKEDTSSYDDDHCSREIWIRPTDGTKSQRMAKSALCDHVDYQELCEMSIADLNKQFLMSFIQAHGILFTKVGVEKFPLTVIRMLAEFAETLQREDHTYDSTKLLQFMALNMFTIHDCSHSEGGKKRNLREELSLVMAFQMFSLLVNRCSQLLKKRMKDTRAQINQTSNLTKQIAVLLPVIKIWCNWLICQEQLWNPPPSCEAYKLPSYHLDCWNRLADLTNILLSYQSFLKNEKIFISHPENGYEEIKALPEDILFYGFTPLMSNMEEPVYHLKDCDKEALYAHLRIRRILFCCTVYLCGIDPPALKLRKTQFGNSEYVSCVEYPTPDVPNTSQVVQPVVEEEREIEITPPFPLFGKTGEVNPLVKKRDQLLQHCRRQYKLAQELIEAETKVVTLEVRPYFLIPDTNCFILHLDYLQSLIDATYKRRRLFSLMVPLIVRKELEKLSRNDPNTEMHIRASYALDFLRDSKSIKCVTSRGNVLGSTVYAQHEQYPCRSGCNDDIILKTCISLKECKEALVSGTSERQICRVVLLTDDRLLRVKAMASRVPVRSIEDFMSWVKLPPQSHSR